MPGGPVLVNFSAGATDVLVQRSDVSAARQLTVEEIIARHQLQQRTQDALVHSYIADARMDQHFRPNVADPGYDVASTNRYFVSGDDVEWEELSFSVNGTKWGPDRPSFPLLQAEKVLSLPLQLRFDNDYRYRLAGTERVGEYDCYVVRFDPVGKGQSLYRGTVWIERRTFARVKVQAVQTALSAPVVSNEEIQTYAPVASIGNRPIFLFTGLTARQIMLIAGRNLLVEKSVAFSDFRVNPEAFEGSREEARRSDRIMYRETDRGLRYYVKEGAEPRHQRALRRRARGRWRWASRSIRRTPSRCRSSASTISTSRSGARTRSWRSCSPACWRRATSSGRSSGPRRSTRSIDFFAIAVPSSDRVYDADGEHEQERAADLAADDRAQSRLAVHAVPETVRLLPVPVRRLHARHHDLRDVRRAGEHDHQRLRRRRGSTAAAATARSSNGAWFARAGMARVGRRRRQTPTTLQPIVREIQRQPVARLLLQPVPQDPPERGVVRRHAISTGSPSISSGCSTTPVSTVCRRRASASRSSGRHAARTRSTSSTSTGSISSSSARGAATGRSTTTWQPITGLGAAINFRAPKNTILRADFGKSFLPDRYRGIGSATLQVMILKPLK